MKSFREYLNEVKTTNEQPKTINGVLGVCRQFEHHLHLMELAKGNRTDHQWSETQRGYGYSDGLHIVSDATAELLEHHGHVPEDHPSKPGFKRCFLPQFDPHTGYFHQRYEKENTSGPDDEHTEKF